MKKYGFSGLVRLFAGPVLTVVLGLILLFDPDAASALIGKLLAWVLVLIGIGCAASALFGTPLNRTSRGIWAAVFLICGFWLMANPMFPAKFIGRILGLVLMLQGGRDISLNIKDNGGVTLVPGFILACAVALTGLVLLVLPMTTSRILFSVCGIVLILVGGAEIIDRIKGPRRIHGDDDDPNIIDAL